MDAQAVKDIVAKSKYWKYLEDSSITLYGINIYGSPWQPFFCNWAFNLPRGEELASKWSAIPQETDVLLTHGAPFCHGDKIPMKYALMGDGIPYVGSEII